MKRPCPKYQKAHDEYLQSDEIQSIFESNRTLIQYLEKYSGEQFKTLLQIKAFYEALWIENLKGFTLPQWTQKIFTPDGDLKKIAHFSYQMQTPTTLMKRLKAGFLIRDMFERFAMKANATLSPDRSMFVYSAHDITIVNVMRTLNLAESRYVPPYASCLMFELHRINGSFYLKVYYKRDRGEDNVPLKALVIQNCGETCPLSKLNDLYRDIIPIEDFETECGLSHSMRTDDQTMDDSNSIRHLPRVYLTVGFITFLTLI